MEINLSLTKLIILIILTSLFGYTILGYLGEISSKVGELLGYITLSGAKLGAVAIKKTGETAEAGVDMIAGKVERVEGSKDETLRDRIIREERLKKREEELSKDLEKALDRREMNGNTSYVSQSEGSDLMQSRGNVKKQGYCYVGVDNSIRSCVKVYKNDTCMSGNIYPTQEICMNPDLRL